MKRHSKLDTAELDNYIGGQDTAEFIMHTTEAERKLLRLLEGQSGKHLFKHTGVH